LSTLEWVALEEVFMAIPFTNGVVDGFSLCDTTSSR